MQSLNLRTIRALRQTDTEEREETGLPKISRENLQTVANAPIASYVGKQTLLDAIDLVMTIRKIVVQQGKKRVQKEVHLLVSPGNTVFGYIDNDRDAWDFWANCTQYTSTQLWQQATN
jgi:hypothetical protein